MSNTVRTLAQLLALFLDNTEGDISAQDGRDLIASAFGFVGNGIPVNTNDSDDTAGIGSFFDSGSRWTDTLGNREYFCITGSPGAALWKTPLMFGDLAGGRLGGTYPNPVLAASGVVAGDYGDSLNYPTFHVNADGTLSVAGQLPLPGSTIPIPLLLISPSDPTNIIELRQHSVFQSGDLLQCQEMTGIVFGARITGSCEFSDPGPYGSSGINNERFGHLALHSNQTGFNNNAMGFKALYSNISGSNNNAVGQGALAGNIDGNGNTAIGSQAGNVNAHGNFNIAIGANSQLTRTSGSHAISFGVDSLFRSTATGSVAIGSYSQYRATTGLNTTVGHRSGYTITTGNCITCVGSGTEPATPTDTDEIVIGCSVVGNGTHTITLGTFADSAFVGATVLPASNPINQVLASPGSGSAGALGVRALVAGDVPPLPASQITSGTFALGLIPGLPASQITSGTFALGLIPGLPASQVTSGTFSAGLIPSLDTIAGSSGALSATNVGTGYPWADLSGVPGDLALTSQPTATGTTTNIFTNVFTVTNANGLHGTINVENTNIGASGHAIQFQVLSTDLDGTVTTGSTQVLAANAKQSFNIEVATAVLGAGVLFPTKKIEIDVVDAIGGNHNTFLIRSSLVG